LEKDKGSEGDGGVGFGMVKNMGDEVGEFCRRVRGGKFGAGKEVSDEASAEACRLFVPIEGVWFQGKGEFGRVDDPRVFGVRTSLEVEGGLSFGGA
jgi:hypothetical protein